MRVLISGASFAGLATAYWMRDLGHEVTVVEIARELRRGGTAVNVQENTIEVVRRMGLLEQIQANRMDLRRWEFRNAQDQVERALVIRADGTPPSTTEYEIERDVLLDLLVGMVTGVELVFDDSIVAMRETEAGLDVSFARGPQRTFDLVVGCDGAHSTVRRLWFGPEAQFTRFLGQYFAIAIVDKLLVERDTAQMFNTPGKAVMLNAYKNKTDVIFAFAVDSELAYDYRDQAAQRRIIAAQFAGQPWRTAELLGELEAADNFYFDKLCQIHMPTWSKGRVVLVGDAAYCASPAAGRGGSLALDGAAALADALREHGTYADAFQAYDERFRPFIEEVQAQAVQFGLESLVPATEEAIRARNAKTSF